VVFLRDDANSAKGSDALLVEVGSVEEAQHLQQRGGVRPVEYGVFKEVVGPWVATPEMTTCRM
jgi:hypothetical protein